MRQALARRQRALRPAAQAAFRRGAQFSTISQAKLAASGAAGASRAMPWPSPTPSFMPSARASSINSVL
ncbi:hypothetical protein [Chitinimonas koreensis]|uniref:hypothetical protein n=1 Tax=Chitinimonas koreensis TaxID=356302 RepID=UPI00223F95BB|nr:hypothetical protein [Chitinimonas koreensis]